MPWIIRNAEGKITGYFTNKPGKGNKMPDGSDEVPEYVEDNALEVVEFLSRPVLPPRDIIAELRARIEELEKR